MFSYESLFLPASLEYFWFLFPPVSFKHLYSPSGSLGQAKKDLTEFPKHWALGRLLPPCLLRQGRHPLSPTTEGRACAVAARSQAVRTPRRPFFPSLTPVSNGLGHCCFRWQVGHNMAADKQIRRSRLEGHPHRGTHSTVASGSWASTVAVHTGLGWSLCTHRPAKHFRVTGCGIQRGFCPVLCILIT